MISGPLNNRPFWIKVVVMASSLLLLSLFVLTDTFTDIVSADEPTNQALFTEVTLRQEEVKSDPNFIRNRFVQIDFDLLGGSNGPALDGSGVGERLQLNLFDNTTFTAVMDRLEQNPSGSYTWIGHLVGVEYSQVIFVVNDGLMTGHISMPGGLYDIRYIRPGLHAIAQVNPAVTNGEENDAVEVELPADSASRAPAAINASDDGSVIDVMVVYSDDTVTTNTAPTVEGWIELFMAYTNQAYINSGITQRVSLVHTQEVSYNETQLLSTDLSALRDGNVANVHALRDTYHADFVMLLVSDGDNGNTASCGGLAYLQANVTAGFEANGYSVMEACSFGSSVFAHELGHNMGASHDWYMSDTTAPYSYAHGYVDTTNLFLTIMAYNNHCNALGLSCNDITYFSNPDVTYNGQPAGVAEGTSTSCTTSNTGNPACDADVRKTLNNTAANSSAFRSSEIVWTGATSSDWGTASNWTMEEGVSGSTTTVQRLPRSIDNVKIPAGTPNAPVISANADTRNVLIETGATLSMTGGILSVYGDWEEQGTAQTTATAGTVIFKSNLDQSIATSSSSSFYAVQIGDSTTQKVTLSSNVDVNSTLTIKAGSTLVGSSYTINVAGNWDDEGNGFEPGTSTVVLDGTYQTVDKVTTSTLLSEDFNSFTGCCTTAMPSGWAKEKADGFGFATGSQIVRRWSTTTDAWLMTNALALQPGITYEIEYKYATSGGTSDFNVYLGTAQSSSTMLSGTLIHTAAGVNSSSYQTATATFTVPTTGDYYIGFRNQRISSGGSGDLDDISIKAMQDITFYNLTTNSDNAVFNQDVAITNNLVVNASKLMDISTHGMTVEGSVNNGGSLQQSKDVSTNATTYEFLTIKNAAGSATKYYGVNITPDGGSGLGSTSVRIGGSQSCTDNTGDTLVNRCFNITPTSTNSATIKYWYTEGERNAQSANLLKVWDWNNSAWTLVGSGATYGETGTSCSTDLSCWAQWTGISTYSPMVLGSNTAPTGNPGSVPVATPTPTTTPTASATSTPTMTPTPSPTSTPTMTPTPGATSTSTMTPTPGATSTPTMTPTPGTAVSTPVPSNLPPQLDQPIADITVIEGAPNQPLNLLDYFSDPDGDLLFFVVMSNSNRTVVLTPLVGQELEQLMELQFGQPGQTEIIIQAEEDIGHKTYQTSFMVTVLERSQPNLSISQSVSDHTVEAGQQITYTIAVTNSGLGMATNAIINDQLPDDLTFIDGSMSATDMTSGLLGSGLPIVASNMMLSPNNTVNVSFAATVNQDVLSNQTISNIAQVTSTEVITPIYALQTIQTMAPTLSISDVMVMEANTRAISRLPLLIDATFHVMLSRASALPVTIDFTTVAGSATEEDYVAASGTLTIPTGAQGGVITVQIIDDELNEEDETFTLQLSNPSNVTLVNEPAKATITDNDDAPTSVSLGRLSEQRTSWTPHIGILLTLLVMSGLLFIAGRGEK